MAMVKQENRVDIFAYDIIDNESWASSPASERTYSADHIIEAYIKGKDTGKNEFREFLSSKLRTSIERAGALTGEVFKALEELGINAESSFMKIEDISCFRILIVVSESDFLKEEVFEAYNIIATIQGRYKHESDINIDVVLCPRGQETENFDSASLVSDGYHFRYSSK